MTGVAGSNEFDVVSVTIGEYRQQTHPTLPADAEAVLLTDVLRELGGRPDLWQVPPGQRDLSRVVGRLKEWSNAGPRNSVMFWAGHGASDGNDAYLATHDSGIPINEIGPDQLALRIREEWGRRRVEDGAWTIVAIEACGAKRFVQQLSSELTSKPNVPERLAVIGSGGEGTTYLGEFRNALSRALDTYTINDVQIELADLVGRLRLKLPEGWVQDLDLHLARPVPREAGSITAPLDVYAELRDFIDALPVDERSHFLPKARGGEQGELAWYFVGRSSERGAISAWLRTSTSGMLVVTGGAGSGKSALLGNVLVHTNPALRELLSAAGRFESIPDDQRPPDRAFDAVVHLTGMSTAELIGRLADAAGVGIAHEAGTGSDIDALLDAIGERPFCVLVDALDEAQEPAIIATSVLRRIAALPAGRVVVGTRRSTGEGLDEPDTAAEDLLDALGRVDRTVVEVGRDPEALATYVRSRLSAAARHGTIHADGATIDRVVDLVGSHDRQFLYARLAVHEIMAQPSLLDAGRAADLRAMLSQDHRALFAAATERLTAVAPANLPLLEALALAYGRGLPYADHMWAIVANALSEDTAAITDNDIDELLTDAAPYIMLDAEAGQSVYRLAHQTFKEHFLVRHSDRHSRIASALVTAGAAALPAAPSPYLTHHLSNHVAAADAWQHLADVPDLLDHLDSDIVATDAFRTAFGRAGLPIEIASTMSVSHLLAAQPPMTRAGTRQFAAARLGGHVPVARPTAPWTVRWAHLLPERLHMTLTGHRESITRVMAFPMSDGHVFLISVDYFGTVLLWDPATGQPAGKPFNAHTRSIHESVATVVPGSNGRALVAMKDGDTIRLWDPMTGDPVGPALTDERIEGFEVVRQPGGSTLLAVSCYGGVVRLRDPATGNLVRTVQTNHPHVAGVLAAVPVSGGRVLLATAGRYEDSNRILLWDVETGDRVDELTTGRSRVNAMTAVPLADGRTLLAAAGSETTLLWDLATRRRISEVGTEQREWVNAVTAVPLPGGGSLLAAAGSGTVRLWEPESGKMVGEPVIGQLDNITSVASVPMPDGRVLLATGSADNTVRLWEPALGRFADPHHANTTRPPGPLMTVSGSAGRTLLATAAREVVRLREPTTGEIVDAPIKVGSSSIKALAAVRASNGRTLLAIADVDEVTLWDFTARRRLSRRKHQSVMNAMAALPLRGGRILLAIGTWDDTVRLWDPFAGKKAAEQLPGHKFGVTAMAPVPMPDDRIVLAVASSDNRVRLWDPDTRSPATEPLPKQPQPADALIAFPLPDGSNLLAVTSRETVSLWDPVTGDPVGERRTGHTLGITAMAMVQAGDGRTLLATGSRDQSIRLWDPIQDKEILTLVVGGEIIDLAAVDHGLAVALTTGIATIDLHLDRVSCGGSS